MIELKNINLDGITIEKQVCKIVEELEEFIEAIINDDIDNAIEEYFDMIQAGLGVLHKLGIDAEQVMSQYPKHIEKIKNRPRDK